MLEQNERMSKFLEAIDHDAQERRRQIEREIDEEMKQELVKAEQEAKDKGEEFVRREMEKLHVQTHRTLAQENNTLHAALAGRRMEIQGEVFRNAEQQLLEFAKTQQYLSFLQESAERFASVFPEGDVTLFVKKEDLQYSQAIKAAFGRACRVEEDDAILLGGGRAKCADKGLLADDTLDNRLRQQYEWFFENSGLTIHD